MITLADEFEKWLRSEGLSKEGIRNLVSQYYEFCSYCADRMIKISDLCVSVTRDYILWLNERPNYHNGQPLSTGTKAKHFTCLWRISSFLMEHGLIKTSLLGEIRRPRRQKPVIHSFSTEQLQAIMDTIRDMRANPKFKERMALLVYLLASTGLRIEEARNLRLSVFDHYLRRMIVLGKGNKEREVPFSEILSDWILDYAYRYNLGQDDLLFASRYNKPLASSTIRDALRKTGKALGTHLNIDRMRVSPHTFRHTFARSWVTKGGNTLALTRILGHSSTAMTLNYVRLWGVDLNQAYDQCDPCGDIKVPRFQ
ncbi:tyrosine-type recombinase/integrase [Paenibacillus sp. FSL L8-0340]|uniref:tyrosine-type recombinase/integrase n=1 Tax=Paenibacillus sp. FSL L8-0340 TaxID=2954685 RepID=UPI0031591D44